MQCEPASKINRLLEEAYIENFSQLYKHIFFKVNNKQLAEDLAQETFIKTWEHLKDNRCETVNNLKGFLFKVARNLVIDYYRQKEKTPVSLDEAGVGKTSVEPLQVRQIDSKLRLESFKKSLAKLEKKQREILEYRFLQEMEIEEICELTGKSPNYISVLIYQGLKRIKSTEDGL